jgi:hypothetical protein
MKVRRRAPGERGDMETFVPPFGKQPAQLSAKRSFSPRAIFKQEFIYITDYRYRAFSPQQQTIERG